MCSLQLWSNYHRLQYLINSDTRHCTTVQCSQCTLPCNKHQLFQSTLANVSQTDKTNLSVKYHLVITSWNTKSYERIFLNYIAIIDIHFYKRLWHWIFDLGQEILLLLLPKGAIQLHHLNCLWGRATSFQCEFCYKMFSYPKCSNALHVHRGSLVLSRISLTLQKVHLDFIIFGNVSMACNLSSIVFWCMKCSDSIYHLLEQWWQTIWRMDNNKVKWNFISSQFDFGI